MRLISACCFFVWMGQFRSGADGAALVPNLANGGVFIPVYSGGSRSMSKRFFVYSSGYGAGGHSTGQNENENEESSTDTPSDRSKVRKNQPKWVSDCYRILKSLADQLNQANVKNMSEEDAAEVRQKMKQVYDDISRRLKENTVKSRSKRSSMKKS